MSKSLSNSTPPFPPFPFLCSPWVIGLPGQNAVSDSLSTTFKFPKTDMLKSRLASPSPLANFLKLDLASYLRCATLCTNQCWPSISRHWGRFPRWEWTFKQWALEACVHWWSTDQTWSTSNRRCSQSICEIYACKQFLVLPTDAHLIVNTRMPVHQILCRVETWQFVIAVWAGTIDLCWTIIRSTVVVNGPEHSLVVSFNLDYLLLEVWYDVVKQDTEIWHRAKTFTQCLTACRTCDTARKSQAMGHMSDSKLLRWHCEGKYIHISCLKIKSWLSCACRGFYWIGDVTTMQMSASLVSVFESPLGFAGALACKLPVSSCCVATPIFFKFWGSSRFSAPLALSDSWPEAGFGLEPPCLGISTLMLDCSFCAAGPGLLVALGWGDLTANDWSLDGGAKLLTLQGSCTHSTLVA